MGITRIIRTNATTVKVVPKFNYGDWPRRCYEL